MAKKNQKCAEIAEELRIFPAFLKNSGEKMTKVRKVVEILMNYGNFQ